ncbi:germin-like protein subfamily 2 member 4 [Vigna angularis]|uniref:germin-like protein subfamily 2 member 4 n=1 Tax=Phaseolus angularis TaxID=3914 RepID=UPI000809E01E|nr:germin-like protein subfamily 2 member 4 [Vigna angularis]
MARPISATCGFVRWRLCGGECLGEIFHFLNLGLGFLFDLRLGFFESFVASALGLTVRKSSFEVASVKVDGFACKAETNVTEADFFFAGLAKPEVINNTLGSLVTIANVEKIPGLNTLGVSFSRIDYKAGVLNPPHTRPRAIEILFVLDGQLDVGFITTANKLISKSIKKGEIFVFSKGLLHYQKNSGDKPASVLCALNNQLPGTFSVVAALLPKNHSTTSI